MTAPISRKVIRTGTRTTAVQLSATVQQQQQQQQRFLTLTQRNNSRNVNDTVTAAVSIVSTVLPQTTTILTNNLFIQQQQQQHHQSQSRGKVFTRDFSRMATAVITNNVVSNVDIVTSDKDSITFASTFLSAAVVIAVATAAASISYASGICSGQLSYSQCEEQQSEIESSTLEASSANINTSSPLKNPVLATSSSVVSPAIVSKENLQELIEQSTDKIDSLPIYSVDEVAVHDGSNGTTVWMTYGGIIYDVTDFIANHPGGSSKIMLAAGSHIEPFWYLYRQHFNTDMPLKLMEHMAIGRLSEHDQDSINEQLAILEQDDPYAKEPTRHSSLIVHGDTPMNAELPSKLLTESYITPTSLFYIRHHHPVPLFTDKDIATYTIDIDLSNMDSTDSKNNKKFSISLDELKQMPKTELIVTLQCSGNRRSGFNYFGRTSGTPWGQGAVSTGKFVGVRIYDLLKKAGVDVSDPITIQETLGINHIIFTSMDGMETSIPIEKVLNPYGDCIIAYEMNDEILPRDHGYPVRIIIPGYSGTRSVKWIKSISLSKTDANSPFNRGINYKILPPNVVDANNIDIASMPSVQESSLFSGITKIDHVTEDGEVVTKTTTTVQPGDIVYVKANGWAWAGGGRNIVRVNVTGDEGRTWTTATLGEGSAQKHNRAWAWTFWSCIVPVKVKEDCTAHIACNAIDSSFNIQPESCRPLWNFRGLCNNSWYRAHIRLD